MRVAGVRLESGEVVWLDAGTIGVDPLDCARAEVDGSTLEGEVFVAPEQLLSPPDRIHGRLLGSHPRLQAGPENDFLPGSELPVLGQAVRWGNVWGTVMALDPANGRVTIAHDTGDPIVVPVQEISGD